MTTFRVYFTDSDVPYDVIADDVEIDGEFMLFMVDGELEFATSSRIIRRVVRMRTA